MAVKTAPNTRAAKSAAAAPTASADAKPVRVRRMPLDARAAAAGIMFDASTLCWYRDTNSGTLTQITFGSLGKFLDRLESGTITNRPAKGQTTSKTPARRGRPPGAASKSSR